MLPKALKKLIDELTKLPGIGPKTASRLSFFMLNWSEVDLKEFGQAVAGLRAGIEFCPNCFNMSEGGLCDICKNPNRDQSIIAAVERPLDVVAIESTGDYTGLYHVLGGVIAPLEGIGPEDLKIKELLGRVKKGGDKSRQVKEVILATNADLEGETTAMYLAKQLRDSSVKITRIARGLPIGGELEYADEVTLTSALEGRREYGK